MYSYINAHLSNNLKHSILFLLFLIILILDFYHLEIVSMVLISIMSFLTIYDLIRISKLKKQCLSFFRLRFYFDIKGLIPFVMIVVFIIVVYFISTNYLAELKSVNSFSRFSSFLLILPGIFYSNFLFSTVTFENGIQINIKSGERILWKNIENVILTKDYLMLNINKVNKKIRYHKLDIEDVEVLVEKYKEYLNQAV